MAHNRVVVTSLETLALELIPASHPCFSLHASFPPSLFSFAYSFPLTDLLVKKKTLDLFLDSHMKRKKVIRKEERIRAFSAQQNSDFILAQSGFSNSF